ncbi:ABC transporter substrate-binding protein [Parageobacillus thermoglucosidasius]|uniref:ABC transporter substrate-binding protein n=1 Tax=Parageobacillus thermoglucosidasius TaxID=1426 RepID=UPI000E143538|nr:ABC transporter substrate-binding protein [Parageobacillus thermoglucosidasius]RDE18688.1 extracellular solute-binding protein [Parageobacillus thermoglucosidasius]
MKRWMMTGFLMLIMALAGCGVPDAKPPGESKPAGKPSDNAAEITVAGNGGKIEKAIREVIAPKFEEKYGVKVNFVPGLSGEILSKVELQKNAPQYDVAMYVPLDVQRAADKGLAETLDPSVIPNMAKVDPRFIAVDKVGVPVFGLVIAPAYNTETFKKNGWAPITSWNDLIRPDYKGKTAFADIANDWGFALLYNLANANGGSLDNLEPGLKKAKELASYSDTFYKNSTQMMPAVQQGAADVTVMGSYAIAELIDSGVPLKMVIPKEGAPLQAFSATVVKNAPHKKAAMDFVNFLVSEEAQKQIAESGFYPVLKDMKVAPKYEKSIGLKDSDPVFRPDFKKMAEIREQWTDRWAKEVTPELGKKVKK